MPFVRNITILDNNEKVYAILITTLHSFSLCPLPASTSPFQSSISNIPPPHLSPPSPSPSLFLSLFCCLLSLLFCSLSLSLSPCPTSVLQSKVEITLRDGGRLDFLANGITNITEEVIALSQNPSSSFPLGDFIEFTARNEKTTVAFANGVGVIVEVVTGESTTLIAASYSCKFPRGSTGYVYG